MCTGNFYGTPKKDVIQWLDDGIDVILEIDVQGALQVKKSYPEGVFIFILPPSIEGTQEQNKGQRLGDGGDHGKKTRDCAAGNLTHRSV